MELSPVAIIETNGGYPSLFPYDPHTHYPEYQGDGVSDTPNNAYDGVRELFIKHGYDQENLGTTNWNPLGWLVKPGNKVFIKPNFVTHEYRKSAGRPGDVYSVITHPSVLRAVADYVAIALKGQGEIIIGDNPSIDADFDELDKLTQIRSFEGIYRARGINCRVSDLRPKRTDNLKYYGFKSKTVPQPGDPEGSSVINLGKHSCFVGVNPYLFRGVFSKRWETIKHHIFGKHEYCISNSILNADVYISVPKLKTHHKVGTTLNIKGLVGINANKNFLIHWRIGFPKVGGDEFPTPTNPLDYIVVFARHFLIDLLPDSAFLWLRDQTKGTKFAVIFEDIKCLSFNLHRGSWDGNDTCWRMAADLYKVFVLDLAKWRKKECKFYSLVDGITAGEGSGPFTPDAKQANTLISGENLFLVDCVASRLMGFKINSIRYLAHLKDLLKVDLKNLRVISDKYPNTDFFENESSYLDFVPPACWPHMKAKETAENESYHSCRG